MRVFAIAVLIGCSGSGSSDSGSKTTETTPTTGNGVAIPDVSGATFVDGIDNPYLPFPVGADWEYDKGDEHVSVTVSGETKQIEGVSALVVHDQATVAGQITEDTQDYYAQDTAGNVWYVGEDTCEYTDGSCTDTEGSWTWGVDGALPGWAMPADPTPGDPYHQEWLAGEAEDVGQVLSVGADATVPAGTFTDCIVTQDTSTLEVGVVETKHYCSGIGLVLTEESDGDESLTTFSGVSQ